MKTKISAGLVENEIILVNLAEFMSFSAIWYFVYSTIATE